MKITSVSVIIDVQDPTIMHANMALIHKKHNICNMGIEST